MKDIVITSKRIKTELFTFLACFVVANLLNVYAIIAYGTKFYELITMLGYVFLFSVALYIVWSFLRVVFCFVKRKIITKK